MPKPVGPTDSSKIPRYAGPATFARLPRIEDIERADIAIIGMPFDTGASYRPGARFGPAHIRESSRLLRPYNPAFGNSPFEAVQVADAGDAALNAYDIVEALGVVESSALDLTAGCTRLLALGGDHTITLPLLRAARQRFGPVALLHFDAHLDTWDTYFGAEYTHGTTFRRAAEEELFDQTAACHIGIRGPLYGEEDLADDRRLGFSTITSADVARRGTDEVIEELRELVGERPLYISADIDSLDPAHAPGTGTPEAGGLTSRELLEMLTGLHDLNLVGADLVEVSPPFDHAEITGIAAAHIAYHLLTLMSTSIAGDQPPTDSITNSDPGGS